MPPRTTALLGHIKGTHCTVDGKVDANTLSILLMIMSDMQCELSPDSRDVVEELTTSGLIRWSNSSDQVHGKVFFKNGQWRSFLLTPLGVECVLAVAGELESLGIVKVPESWKRRG